MKKTAKRVIPVIISVILLAILAGYAPWGQVGHILADLDLSTILILVGLSLLYYGSKVARYWYLLRAMGIKKVQLRPVVVSYISAQPVSLLPAGEIYRSHALERYTGVPLSKSIPQFTLQGLLEGAALGSVAFVSALALQTLRLPFLVFGMMVIACVLAIRAGHLVGFVRLLNKLPFVNVTEKTIDDLNKRHAAVLTRKRLPFLFGLSILTELIGAAIAYTSVVGLGGHLNIFHAALFYVIPILVGFFSLLPGGFGASEHSAIGVLLLSDVTVGQAVASTLVMRVTIVGLGVLYGVLAELYGRRVLAPKKGLILSKSLLQ
ncbi:MAG TPA: lysylphosphatidylglycerol synthase transmembrane domain-containing protein [Candidatus Saccharimonadales bacterium]